MAAPYTGPAVYCPATIAKLSTPASKSGWLGRLKSGLTRTRVSITGLFSGGVIDAELLELMKRTPLVFAPAAPRAGPPQFVERKAVNAVRFKLASLLGVPSLEALDRLHVQVDSTIDELGLRPVFR